MAPRPRNCTTATNWSPLARLITLPTTPVSGPVVDADRRAHWHRRLFGDDQSRIDHRVNLTKVAVRVTS